MVVISYLIMRNINEKSFKMFNNKYKNISKSNKRPQIASKLLFNCQLSIIQDFARNMVKNKALAAKSYTKYFD